MFNIYNVFRKMISEEYFQDEQQLKDRIAKLTLIAKLPQAYLQQYFDDLTLQLDISAEKLIGLKLPNQADDVKAINQARQTMLDYISILMVKLSQESKLMQLVEKIDTKNIDLHTMQIRKLLFNNKWIFFHPNRNLKFNQNDFGRLIVVEHILSEDLTLLFNKIGNFNSNSGKLKRFILSKNGKKLDTNFLKLYSISRLISESLKDCNKHIVEIKENEIFRIEEVNFERFELVSIDQLKKPDEQWSSLTSLDLNHNKIKNIALGSFLNLTRLKNLNLSFNKLELIGSNWFINLVNLEQLDVSNNRISHLEPDCFTGLKNLKILNLSGNRLSSISPLIFERLSSLLELEMSCNNFQLIPNDMFKGLNSLEKLYLNSNEIDFVEQNALKTLYSLKELHLNMNKLVELEESLFADQLNTLVKIDFRLNEIRRLSPKIFDRMSALKIVLLYGNIDLIHELDQKDFCRITGSNELVNYLTFDGNYYDSEEEMDEDDDEDDEEEMEYNSDASESDEEKDNYDSDF